MRSIPNGQDKIATRLKVEIDHDDGTTEVLTDRLRSASLSIDIDSLDWDCNMTFNNHPNFVNDNLSLDPLDENSSLNKDGSGSYDPILSEYHEVRLYMRKADSGAWYLIFQGWAGGGLDAVKVVEKDDTIDFSPYGITMPYKEDVRLSKYRYENRDLASSLLSSILLDSGFSGDRAKVVIEDDPKYTVTEMVTGEKSAWECLNNAIHKTGYVIGSRYQAAGTSFNDGSGATVSSDGYYLTLYDPQRSKTVPDATFNGNFAARRLDHNLDDVRTWVQVVFTDRTTGKQKKTTPQTNETSRKKYGLQKGGASKAHRKMRLVEDSDSLIDTEGEADQLAAFALHDLEDPTPDVEIEMPYVYPNAELHDLIRFVAPDYTIDVGITGIDISVDAENMMGSTKLRGVVDKVIGRRAYWLARGEMTSEERSKRREEWLMGGVNKLPTPKNLELRTFPHQSEDGTVVSAVAASWEKCRAWWFDHTEVWVSIGTNTRYGDQPYMTTKKNYAMIKPVPAGEDVYVKVRHIPQAHISPQGVRR